MDPIWTNRAVKSAVLNQPPKLIFSVCQALGAVGCVLLSEHIKKKMQKKNENAERSSSSGSESGGKGESGLRSSSSVCNKERDSKCLHCVRRISNILIAMLRHGLMKVE